MPSLTCQCPLQVVPLHTSHIPLRHLTLSPLVPCMIDLDNGCEHLEFPGAVCTINGSYPQECKMKPKKTDKSTNDFQLRLDLRADRPVQRNDMQQMKLEAFMSRESACVIDCLFVCLIVCLFCCYLPVHACRCDTILPRV